jgi:hypothetical protein
VPVSVAVDSLEDSGGKATVEDLWRQDIKPLCQEYTARNQDKKPVVQVEPIVPPGDDYRPDNALFTLCSAAEELGDQESGKPGLIAEYAEEDKDSNQTDKDYLLFHPISGDNPI